MKLTQYFGLFWVAAMSSLLVWLGSVAPAVSQPVVQLQTEPPLDQVVPATEPVQLTLQAVDSSQRPLADANIAIRLLTPAKTPWLTSDFPIVEGTTLLAMNAIAPTGVLQIEQTLPIRGTYRLEATVSPQIAGRFAPFTQVLTFSVPENPVKYRNVAILAAILLVVGLGSGWVLGGNHTLQTDEIAPKPVRMLLSGAIIVAIIALLVVNVSSEIADLQDGQGHSHGDHSHTHSSSHSDELPASTPASQNSEGIRVQILGDTVATVGQMATQTVQVTDAATNQPITDIQITLQAVALEHNERVFALTALPDSKGTLTWQQQFFDGAPHQITATVEPTGSGDRPFAPIQVAHKVDVDGVVPPLSVRLISLIYFTSIFVAGLLLGLVIRRRFRTLPLRSSTV